MLKLIYLKSKFSNDDKRFKIDERFVEDEDDEEEEVDEDDLGPETEGTDDQEDEEDEEAKPKKVDEKQLKREKLNALKILEEITAKPILRPVEDEEKRKERRHGASRAMVRYDPTKEEHRKYEVTEEKEESESNESNEDEKEPSEKKPPTTAAKPVEDTTKYFKIEPNLKDLFSSSDVFKFKFTNDEEPGLDEENSDESEKEDFSDRQRSRLKSAYKGPDLKKSKYSSSSSSSEGESEDEEPVESMPKKIPGRQIQHGVVKSLIPDLDTDKDIQEALDYFGGKPDSVDLETFRKDWASTREKLIQVNSLNKLLINIFGIFIFCLFVCLFRNVKRRVKEWCALKKPKKIRNYCHGELGIRQF